jgi:hypothetical protein
MEGIAVSDEGTGGYAPDELEVRAFEHEFLPAHGPLPPSAGCPIGWQPSALTPVFHGVRHYDLVPPTDPTPQAQLPP